MVRRSKQKRGKAKSSYRNTIARPIQMADMKPSTALVRFQGQRRFSVAQQAGSNAKSILTIPMAYLGEPIQTAGTWTAQDNTNYWNSSYVGWYSKYNHYKVMGMKVTATIKPLNNAGQSYSQVLMIRTTTQAPFGPAADNKSLEQSFGAKKQNFSFIDTSFKSAQARISSGYSPKKQLGIKDVKDNQNLRAPTQYSVAAGENTFLQVILAGVLDSDTSPHTPSIVDVRTEAILHFEEPIATDNIPTKL